MNPPEQSSSCLKTRQGRIVEWNTEHGFGFVRCGSENWFLHLRGFTTRDLVPAKGDRVRFIPGADPKGRPCAAEAVLVPRQLRTAVRRGFAQLLFFFLPLLAILSLPVDFRLVCASVLWLSLLTFLVYWRDKEAALAGGRRTPEAFLHFLEFVGGWPGALIAQRRLRHKTLKPDYQRAFWLLVLCHQVLAFDLVVLVAIIWQPR